MEKDPESSEATTLVGMFDSGAVNGKYHSTEGSQEVDTKGTNEQLAARLVELEEQNKLLLSENAVLGDSVKLYQSLLEDSTKEPVDVIPPKSGHPGNSRGFKKGQRRRQAERSQKILSAKKTSIAVESITSDMSEDALMVGTLNHLVALVKKLALSKQKRLRDELKRKQELEEQLKSATPGFHALDISDDPKERSEALEDSLRHVFVDAVHLMSELIIDPTSTLSMECAQYFGNSPENSNISDSKAGSAPSSPDTESKDWLSSSAAARSNYVQEHDTIRHPITWLLDQYPVLPRGEGAQYDCKDWLPLHWSCVSEADELIDVETLLEHYGASAYYEQTMPPLLLAVAKDKPNIDICTTLISYFNAANIALEAERSFNENDAPGTPSSPSAGSSDIVDIVSVANPADGVYPLMIAAAYNENEELLQLFHEICPKSMWETDRRGWRAIHYAALKGHPLVVKYLMEQHPKCATSTTRNGCYPLHHAARNHFIDDTESFELLTEIFSKNTGAISAKDSHGALPLHYAAREGTYEGVQFLCQTYPKATQKQDAEGLLPMHYASSRSEILPNKTEVVEYILKQKA